MTDPARAARLTALWNQVARAEDEAIGDHLSLGSFSHLVNPILFQLEQAEQARDTAHAALTELRKYACHKIGCDVLRMPCHCGLDAALAASAPQKAHD